MTKEERFQKEYAQNAYAEKVNRINREEVQTLTEEQHEAIADIRRMRHYMHVNALNDIWGSECNSSDTYSYTGGIMRDSIINDTLRNAGLPEIELEDYDECETVDTYDYFCETDEEREDAADDAKTEILRICEKNDEAIICYLQDIDHRHGTNYAPTGLSRSLI